MKNNKLKISTKILASAILGISVLSSCVCVNAQTTPAAPVNAGTMLQAAAKYGNVSKTNWERTSFITNANEDELTRPFDSSLYYARNVLKTENAKAGFDYALQNILKYNNDGDKYKIVKDSVYNEDVAKFDIDFGKAGIKVSKDDVNWIQRALISNESRVFLLKDWQVSGRPQDIKMDSTNQYVDTWTVNVGNGFAKGHSYLDALKEIETQTTKLLGVVKPWMNNMQAAEAVRKDYEASIKYAYEGSYYNMYGSLGHAHTAVCDGFTKGYMYLLMRLGIPALWIKGDVPVTDKSINGSHAWNNVNFDGKWYVMDTTWHWGPTGSKDTQAATGRDYVSRTVEKDWLVKSPTLQETAPKAEEVAIPTAPTPEYLAYKAAEKAAADKAAADKAAADKAAADKAAADKSAADKAAADKAAADKAAVDKAAADKAAADKAAAEKAAAGQVPAGQVPAGQLPGANTHAGQVPDGKLPVVQTVANQLVAAGQKATNVVSKPVTTTRPVARTQVRAVRHVVQLVLRAHFGRHTKVAGKGVFANNAKTRLSTRGFHFHGTAKVVITTRHHRTTTKVVGLAADRHYKIVKISISTRRGVKYVDVTIRHR